MLEFNQEVLAFLRQSHLFSGLSDYQITELLPLIREISVKEGVTLIQENEVSDEIYLIKEGELAVTKLEPTTGSTLQLALLGPGTVVGELTLLDNAPRSASVRALKPSVLLALSITELRALAPGEVMFTHIADKLIALAKEAKSISAEPPLYSVLVQNLARNLSQRMRTANEAMLEGLRKELAQMKVRMAMGIILVTTIVIMSLYALVLESLTTIKLLSPTLLSSPLIAVFSILILIAIKKSRYPWSFFGITLNNWRRSAIEGIVFTIPFLLLITLYKWVLIYHSVEFAGHSVFEFNPGALRFPHPYLVMLVMLIGYMLFVPLQEMMVRGALQGPLQEFLVSPHRVFWAILVSNLIFATTHFHISMVVGIAVYIPGLFWGWLYARHKTLVGVVLSHQLVGVWALFFVGLF